MSETTINGIDVSECCCFEHNRCLWSKRYYENNNVAPLCEAVKNCYFKQFKRLQKELDIKEKMLDKFMIGSGEILEKLQKENEELKETINRLQKDCKRNNDLYMKERDKNYKLSEISKEYNARRCIEKLYRLICDDTKSVQETYIALKDEVSEFLRIHKTMSSKYEEAKQTYKQALEEIRDIIELTYYSKGISEEPLSQLDFMLDAINDYEQRRIKILIKINEVLNDRD